MARLFNYHTHSFFSDGSAAPEEYVQEAIRQGFDDLGFSEHSVLPFENTFALKPGSEISWASEINRLKAEYRDEINIFLALEADFVPDMCTGFAQLKHELNLDYVIGSVHLVRNGTDDRLWFIDGPRRETYDSGLNDIFAGDIKAGVTAYWHQINQMVEQETFDIVGHLDKIKMHNQGRLFDENAGWYTGLIDETLSLISEKNLIVEVNTRGIYKGRSSSLFPGEYILKQLSNRSIPVTLSSDAHQPGEISLWFSEAKEIMKACGIKACFYLDKKVWKEIAI